MAARDIRTASQSQVSIFHQVSSILSSDLSLDEMLGEVIGLAVRATACDACLVYLIDHGSNEIVLRASQVPHAGALGMLRLKIVDSRTINSAGTLMVSADSFPDINFRRFS